MPAGPGPEDGEAELAFSVFWRLETWSGEEGPVTATAQGLWAFRDVGHEAASPLFPLEL